MRQFVKGKQQKLEHHKIDFYKHVNNHLSLGVFTDRRKKLALLLSKISSLCNSFRLWCAKAANVIDLLDKDLSVLSKNSLMGTLVGYTPPRSRRLIRCDVLCDPGDSYSAATA